MKKLLKLLTNAPVAVALAFLLVGAPAAPMTQMLPSSGDAMAYDYGPCGGYNSPGMPDADCDGVPDYADLCPYDPNPLCVDSYYMDYGTSWWEGYLDGGIWPFNLTQGECLRYQDYEEEIAETLAAGAAILAWRGIWPGALGMAAAAGLIYIDSKLGRAVCYLVF